MWRYESVSHVHSIVPVAHETMSFPGNSRLKGSLVLSDWR